MIARFAIAGGVLMIATLFSAEMAAANPVALASTLGASSAAGTLVEKAQWRGCYFWRHECARRWGWGGYRFRRCLRRHGC